MLAILAAIAAVAQQVGIAAPIAFDIIKGFRDLFGGGDNNPEPGEPLPSDLALIELVRAEFAANIEANEEWQAKVKAAIDADAAAS